MLSILTSESSHDYETIRGIYLSVTTKRDDFSASAAFL